MIELDVTEERSATLRSIISKVVAGLAALFLLYELMRQWEH
jgi:hypothetical protein